MKNYILAVLTLFPFFGLSAQKGNVDYVNSYIGTAAKGEGGLAPFVGPPFSMTNFLPQTRENRMGQMSYYYEDGQIMGFMASHQPTVWMGDYGYSSIMPQVGALKPLPGDRKINFSHQKETVSPYYYRVEFGTPAQSIVTELTSSSRCAIYRFTFPKTKQANLIIQGINLNEELTDWCNDYGMRLKSGMKGWIKIDTINNAVIGYNPDRQSMQLGPDLPNFKGYFVYQFDRPIEAFGTWDRDKIFQSVSELSGTRMGGWVGFNTSKDTDVKVKVATSFISIEQAYTNLSLEIPDWNFEKVKVTCKKQWNEKLGKIALKSANTDDLATFYTALYHCYLFPREFSEYGRYYSAFDDKLHDGFSFTDFSLWDTFRAYHPLMSFFEPKLTGDWITSLLQMYKEGGWLPMWPNPSYTNIMIGTHADAFIADAYMKGIRHYDVNLAYQAIRKNAFTPPDRDTERSYGDRDRWTSFEARAGASFYHSLGYIPADKTAESLSRTLEYAFDDWCVAQVAKSMGQTEDQERLIGFSQNYRNLYNTSKGFFLPRRYDGSWIDLEDQDRTGLTEGSKWTYLFCVLQDVPGMVDLMGGKAAFSRKLDRNYQENHYCHDNEPGHHYDYLYNYCDQSWKTQELVRKHVRENYHNAPDGINGNDDCGQMSAWYLFSCMGFYPVTPASNTFSVGAPQFSYMQLKMPKAVGEHLLTIRANNLSETNKYVKAFYMDKQKKTTPVIQYEELMNASEIVFEMTDQKELALKN